MNHQDKVKSRIYWQYKNAPKLIQLLMALPNIAQSSLEDQLAKVKAMLDIENAQGEQLDICGRIVGYLSRPAAKVYPGCVFGPVNDDLFRTLIKAKIYRNNSIATIDEIKTAADYILDTETRCLDGLDMTLRMVWFSHAVSIPVQQLVRDYDLIPRPQGVGTREHRVLTYKPFGFGPFYANFRAPFWHGDGLHLYYSVKFTFHFDNDRGVLYGQVVSEDVMVADLDVRLTLTDSAGEEKTVYVVSDEKGQFSVQMEKTGTYTIVAQTQVVTPDCQTAIITSDEFSFLYHIYVTSITASVTDLEVERGESVTFTVDVQPENADNKAFTVHLTDDDLADITLSGNQVNITGVKKGNGEIIITSEDTGMTATVILNVIIIPEVQFVMRIDSLARPLFYVDLSESFTIDYGDGVDSTDYRIVETTSTMGWVFTTRDLMVGKDYTLTVKRSDSLVFYGPSYTPNTLREVVRVSSGRASMAGFAQNATGLYKIHQGAFDNLTKCTSITSAFRGCTALLTLPDGLFTQMQALTAIDYVCYDCTALTLLPDALFAGLSNVTTFNYAFRGCTALTALSGDMFYGCTSAVNWQSAFYNCSALTTLPPTLFRDVPGGNMNNIFQICAKITEIPAELFVNCTGITSLSYAFASCQGLVSVPDALFAGLPKVTTFQYCFNNCQGLKTVGDDVFKNCTAAKDMSYIFYNCTALQAVGLNIFSGCTEATAFGSVFRSCSALLNMPLFTDCNKMTGIAYGFYGCTRLAGITEGAFLNKTVCSDFSYVFHSCVSVKTIPPAVFKGCTSASTFAYAFQNAGVVSIAGDVFDSCTRVTNIQYLFSNCASLASLPATLFDAFVSVTSSTLRVFEYCKALTAIPAGFLDKCVNLTNIQTLFVGCTALTDIPEGLLKYNTKLVSVSALFAECSALMNIPDDLFSTNILISNFTTVFSYTGVMDIPEDLFVNNVNASTFSYVFQSTKITSIPSGLFRNNAKATDFSYAFYYCENLVDVGDGVFNYAAPATFNRMFFGCTALTANINDVFNSSAYSTVTNTSYMFYNTKITGSGLNFISAMPNVTTKTGTFTYVTTLDDLDQIPAEWR